jgi:hypothetical protein
MVSFAFYVNIYSVYESQTQNLSISAVVNPILRSAFFSHKSRDSSVGIALGYVLDDRVLGLVFRWELGIFLFTTVSRTVLGPTQPPIQ